MGRRRPRLQTPQTCPLLPSRPPQIPVLVSDLDVEATVWLKLRLAPMAPYIGAVSFAFVGPPAIKIQLAPYGRVRLMNIPVLQVGVGQVGHVCRGWVLMLVIERVWVAQRARRRRAVASFPSALPSKPLPQVPLPANPSLGHLLTLHSANDTRPSRSPSCRGC